MKKSVSLPENSTAKSRTALQYLLFLFPTLIVMICAYIYMGFQMQAWQLFATAGICLVLAMIVGLAIQFVRKENVVAGMRLLIGSLLVVPTLAAFLFANNIGSMSAIIVFVINLLLVVRTLPQRDLSRFIFLGLASIGAAAAVDGSSAFGLGTQISVPMAGTITLIAGGVIILASVFFLIREFQNLPLSSKLIITFLLIAIIPFLTLGFLLIRVTSQSLRDTVGNNLKTLSTSQANQVGVLLANEEESLRLLSINQVINQQVENIDQTFATSNAATIQTGLKQQEAKWKNLPDDDPLVKQILDNSITQELNDHLNTISNNLDLLVTDKYGAVIAATRRPSNYDMTDQVWWKSAFDDGPEDVFVSQPVSGHAGEPWSIFVSIPIVSVKTKEVIGVLRASYSMEVFIEILKQEASGSRVGADLLLPNGQIYRVEGDIVTLDLDTHTNLDANADKVYAQFFYDEGPSLVSQTQVSTSDPDLAPVLERLNWRVIHDQSTDEALQTVKTVTEVGIFTGLAVLLLTTFIALALARWISRPIIQLTDTAEKIADGDLNTQAVITSKDEIGTLGATFNRMTLQLRQTLEEVQQQAVTLQINTQTLSRQALLLQAATDVSRAASNIMDANDLIEKAVGLIRNRFDLYYVGLFLLDQERQLALLQVANGQTGVQLPENARQLEINDNSTIGWSIHHKEAHVALDGEALLPDAASELALPLISQGRVIGAITIQSKQESAFGSEDISILQTMADQLANGIEKARLYEQIQQRAIELDKANESANKAKDEAEKARMTAESANRSLAAQMWQTTGLATLNNKMRGEQDITTLARNVIQHLCKYLEIHSGAIYILQDKTLQLTGTYAYRPRVFAQQYQVGEDLVGEAVVAKETISNEIPEEYIAMEISQGKILPKFRLIVPVLYDGQVNGVVALESMTEFTLTQKRFVEQAIEGVAIAFMTSQSRSQINELLSQTRQQTEELQAQEEELRASNEELEAQAENLRAARNSKREL